MKPTNRQAGALGDELTNIMIAALIGVFALALVLRAAGTITAFIMSSDPPQVGIAGGVNVLFTPGHPGTALGTEDLNSFAYWMVTAIMLSVLGTVTVWVWSLWRRHSRKIDTDPRRLVSAAVSKFSAVSPMPKSSLYHILACSFSLSAVFKKSSAICSKPSFFALEAKKVYLLRA